MVKLEQRLAAVEVTYANRRTESSRISGAFAKLAAALRQALPDDPPMYIERAHSRQVVYPAAHQWHADKVRALADRIVGGTCSEEDCGLLAGLPTDALDEVLMTSSEFVAMSRTVMEQY